MRYGKVSERELNLIREIVGPERMSTKGGRKYGEIRRGD
jgi:hypothetical protein